MEKRKKQLLKWIIILYAFFCSGLFVSGYLFTINQIIIGDIVYYLTMAIVGILIPYHLCNRFNIGWKELPKNMTVGFLIATVLLSAISFGIGIYGMTQTGSSGLRIQDMIELETITVLNLILVLIPASLAYAILFYGFILEALFNILGKTRKGIITAILISALMLGISHFAAFEEWSNIIHVLEQVVIMTVLSIIFGLYFHYYNSLFFIYVAFLTVKWFTSMPHEVLQREFPISGLGIVILVVTFIIYYLIIGRRTQLKKFKLNFKF
ncbi:hypothetical protein KKC88_02875 [Patescibacteria group bacterium]|nr:hypothetical protein [Patescibacteria group bacterium]MBU1673815.1 hypothetical protein [Patescibacteria group bacterium]MBU1964062.1 hypothetical protein [Patescibacteria group bacterium]